MKPVLLVVAGALVTTLAFPPYGPGLLVVAGVALFLTGLRHLEKPVHGFWAGFAYGTLFIGTLMWWLVRLHPAALVLAPLQGLFFGAYAWWLTGQRHRSTVAWWALATGGWAVMELIRYRVPYGGMEWGAAGYALSDLWITRYPAALIGTTGLTVLVVAVAACIALALVRRFDTRLWWVAVAIAVVYGIAAVIPAPAAGGPLQVAIVQGSTPCPFEHCGPDERFRTYRQHLALTSSLEAGEVDLIVWPESSMGANADPVSHPEVLEAIGTETRRLDAWFLGGSDRPIDDTTWVNVNVLISPEGKVEGEYRKQLPIPFGEFVPFRSIATRLIAELYRVPRDMVPGDGAVVFDLDGVRLGSVISWEGGFSRFARTHAQQGAQLLVVATNNDSYGPGAPTSDIFMGMTRMRATELGLDVIHGAVSGKSVLIDASGEFISEVSGSGVQAVIQGEVVPRTASIYARTGDVLMYGAALAAVALWWLGRTGGSFGRSGSEEE
ncbi:MAG TPA: apolipoprotein N-acyltransferase [Acidimicrobiia bacterium]